jgi:hypothetical protein
MKWVKIFIDFLWITSGYPLTLRENWNDAVTRYALKHDKELNERIKNY